MKLGLDVDGTIGTAPELFASLARAIRSVGGEIHIITAVHSKQVTDSDRSERAAQLSEWGVPYDALYLAPVPIPVNKAAYAAEVELDFFIDNKPVNVAAVSAVCPSALYDSGVSAPDTMG